MPGSVGERFAQALATKDRVALLDLLHPGVDFRGLTPGRPWEADSATDLVDEILLGAWFEDSDHIEQLEDVQVGTVADRQHFSYRLQVENSAGAFVVEQQAYADVEDERISWLRILCSGYRRRSTATA
jgi:hypothetical protein